MSAPEMVSKLMQARTAAHMAHLQTTSFAAHKALEDFYSGIVDFIDSFAETYQGIFGLIKSYPSDDVPTGDPISWLTSLRKWLNDDRDASCQSMKELENIHDEIVALCASTLYKLKFLDGPSNRAEDPEEELMEHKAEPSKEYLKMSKW